MEPLALCLEIISMRAYERAYLAVRDAKDMRSLPDDPLLNEVKDNAVDIQIEALKRWGQSV